MRVMVIFMVVMAVSSAVEGSVHDLEQMRGYLINDLHTVFFIDHTDQLTTTELIHLHAYHNQRARERQMALYQSPSRTAEEQADIDTQRRRRSQEIADEAQREADNRTQAALLAIEREKVDNHGAEIQVAAERNAAERERTEVDRQQTEAIRQLAEANEKLAESQERVSRRCCHNRMVTH